MSILNFEKSLGALNDVKFRLNAIGAELATLKLKQDTVREAQKRLKNNTLRLIVSSWLQSISRRRHWFQTSKRHLRSYYPIITKW